jgi:glycosyltransferase involved in cell wall biosynthesis
MSSCRVSLVVTCHNYGRFLDQALHSLADQTLGEWEAIVIDDASTDCTAEVLRRWSGEPRLRTVSHPRRLGNIHSYNQGLALARGDAVGVLSADDYLLRADALERQVAVFDACPEVGLVFSAHAIVGEGRPPRIVAPWPEDGVHAGLEEFRRLIWGNYVLHSGALLRSDLARELGPYDPELTHTGDWDMWLRAAARRPVGYVAEPLYAYRLHDDNMFHRGLPPARQTDQVLATVERALAALPPGVRVPDGLRVRFHALLQTPWFDLHNGRRRRTWAGLAYGLRRDPRLIVAPELWHFLPRLLLMTAVGGAWYRRLTGGDV